MIYAYFTMVVLFVVSYYMIDYINEKRIDKNNE